MLICVKSNFQLLSPVCVCVKEGGGVNGNMDGCHRFWHRWCVWFQAVCRFLQFLISEICRQIWILVKQIKAQINIISRDP